ncbi:hypothetical protein ACQEU3_15030 [Spirillospora sp. CA-253888]
MPRITDVHPTRLLRTPSGLSVAIDLDMVPVIQALWNRRLTTLMSCQDVGEAMADGGMWPVPKRWHAFLRGHAWLKMPLDDAHALMETLSMTEQFAPRLTAKADDGWDSKVWLGPEGLADYSNIYFPKGQLVELATVLSAAENP